MILSNDDPSGGDGRGCARLGAGGTPATPGKPSSQDIVTPKAQDCRSILAPLVVEGGPSCRRVSSCSFVVRLHQRSAVFPRMIGTGGRGPGSRANGSFPKGARRNSEKSPAKHPPPHRRDGITWERGRPARILSPWLPLSISAMLQAATLWAGTAAARPKESHGAVPG